MNSSPQAPKRRSRKDPLWVRALLIGSALVVLTVLIIIPVCHIFYHALGGGITQYFSYLFSDSDTLHAILLTLIVAPTATVINVVFGLTAAWLITRFHFPGRTLLISLIDLPFAISPIVAGLMLILVFGAQGLFGPWLQEHGIKVLFALPALIIATTFVTLPFVARELIPLMEALGSDEELAAVNLGAGPWDLFWRITLPNVKWALLYGVILCHARALGEFGAVYVVSGHIAGATDTMPLRVEKLFQEYNTPGSFAVASVLTLFALVTLALKTWLEQKTNKALLLADREYQPGEAA